MCHFQGLGSVMLHVHYSRKYEQTSDSQITLCTPYIADTGNVGIKPKPNEHTTKTSRSDQFRNHKTIQLLYELVTLHTVYHLQGKIQDTEQLFFFQKIKITYFLIDTDTQ